jgi:putative endonuclease
VAAYVYMMSNKRYGTVYVGVTNDIVRRAWEHREGMLPGFTSKHGLHDLVWYEQHESIVEAIQREHTMKHWPRKWKTALVDAMNPEWADLFPALL